MVAPACASDVAADVAADLMRSVATESNDELAAALEEDIRRMTAAQGRILVRLGEVCRRQAYRDEGATSVEPWAVERLGVSVPTARALSHVGREGLGHTPPRRCTSRRPDHLRQAAAPWPTWRHRRTSVGSVTTLVGTACESYGDRAAGTVNAQPRRRWSFATRPSVSALQRHLPHHHCPVARRVLRRGQGLSRVDGRDLRPNLTSPARREDPKRPGSPWTIASATPSCTSSGAPRQDRRGRVHHFRAVPSSSWRTSRWTAWSELRARPPSSRPNWSATA